MSRATAPTSHHPAASPGRRRAAALRDASAAVDAPRIRLPRPALRAGLVPRGRLVAQLAAARDLPLALLVAPAGYGKTTLLAQWAEADERPFGWVTLDAEDDDPVVLLTAIGAALEGIEPVGHEFLKRSARGAGGATGLLERVARCVAGLRTPFVLALDDAHHVTGPAALGALAALVEHVPLGSQIVVASRSEPEHLPIGRLRAEHRAIELRPRDLVMTRTEATLLLVGLGLRPSDVDVLMRRTEGWPVGLALAALAVREQADRRVALESFGGGDRFVADYLREELLAGLPRERVTFMRRTSMLTDLSGPLCDAVLEKPGSGVVLRDLARANAMLVPVDRAEGSYRYHGLVAEMLRADLRRVEPEYEPEAHRRASAWHAGRGDVDGAIRHAMAAADDGLTGALLWGVAPDRVMDGGAAVIAERLDRLTPDRIGVHAALSLCAAIRSLGDGDLDVAEHWCAAAERARGRTPDAAATPADADAAIAAVRAFAARDLEALRAHAATVARGTGTFPWPALASFLAGAADLLCGDLAAAREHLTAGARAAAVGAPVVQVLCLAFLGVAELDDDDPTDSEVCISRARAQVERRGLREHPLCAPVLAASALDRARRGRVEEARRDVRDAAHLLSISSGLATWFEAATRALLLRASLRLGDASTARDGLGQAVALAERMPEATVLGSWIEASRGRVDAFASSAGPGPVSLTPAELRVLGLLPTHLSFREIAGDLHVSANTIKTQAHAVYRKLGASSRTEAVARAAQVGLLDARS